MSITINGTGTITGYTPTTVADGSITAAKLASGVGGKILNVVQVTKAGHQAVAYHASNYTDISNFSPSLTPSSSSNKILVCPQLYLAGYGSTSVRLYRKIGSGSFTEEALFKGDNGSSDNQVEGFANTTHDSSAALIGTMLLDTPNTTDEVTYKVALGITYHSSYYGALNVRAANNNNGASVAVRSVFTLMEVAP